MKNYAAFNVVNELRDFDRTTFIDDTPGKILQTSTITF